jgi:integrase
MVLDIYNHKKLHENWKINPHNSNVSKSNNKTIKQYVLDMEQGKNISRHSKKGARSYTRLNHARQKIFFIAELLEKHFKLKDITKVDRDKIHQLFDDMRKGNIKKLNGGTYKSVGDYVKTFKAFWHWYQRIKSDKGIAIPDITIDLDTSGEEPEFVYFSEAQFNEMIKLADPDMKVIMLFMYDTGMRVTEMKNIKVSDFLNNFKEVNIRNETSKTFGRRIKLMMCSEVIEKYIKTMDLKPNNYVFKLETKVMNNRLKFVGRQILKVDNLSLYDIRHSSACYWYPKYPNIQGLLYRFGWKKLNMAHYYARFLGMEDTITEEAMLAGVTKSEIEREVKKLQQELSQVKKVLGSSVLGKALLHAALKAELEPESYGKIDISRRWNERKV